MLDPRKMPRSRIMRAGDILVVVLNGGRVQFIEKSLQERGVTNEFASPVLGVKVFFESGPRAGIEATFHMVWTSPTEHVDAFLFGDDIVLFSELEEGEVCKVLVALF